MITTRAYLFAFNRCQLMSFLHRCDASDKKSPFLSFCYYCSHTIVVIIIIVVVIRRQLSEYYCKWPGK